MAQKPITQLINDWRTGADGAEALLLTTHTTTRTLTTKMPAPLKRAGIPTFFSQIRPKTQTKMYPESTPPAASAAR